jgi:2-polyprenyl-6-methoxyphenol hydroxylase-like FAD-dependent oxidoreductase
MPSPQTVREPDIVIIGAGPAGLATARLLHLAGMRPRVLERDPDRGARSQGGSLDLGEAHGLRALAAAGLMREFHEAARPQGQHTNYFDTDGNLLLSTDGSDEDEARPEIDRTALRSLLLDSLPSGTVRWAHPVTAVEEIGRRWRVTVDGGPPLEADLVIGADGIRSRARPVVTDEAPAYTGVTFLAGEIAHPRPGSCAAQVVGEGAGLVLGPDKGLLCQRNGDGSIRVYVAHRPATAPGTGGDRVDRELLRDVVERELAGWSPRIRGILDEVETPFVRWPLHTVPVRQHWRTRSGLTLVGDAAHVMPPFTGQGVNMGLIDALELAAALTSPEHPDVDGALAAYERAMLARMEEAVAASLAAQDLLISPDGPGALLAMVARTGEEARS